MSPKTSASEFTIYNCCDEYQASTSKAELTAPSSVTACRSLRQGCHSSVMNPCKVPRTWMIVAPKVGAPRVHPSLHLAPLQHQSYIQSRYTRYNGKHVQCHGNHVEYDRLTKSPTTEAPRNRPQPITTAVRHIATGCDCNPNINPQLPRLKQQCYHPPIDTCGGTPGIGQDLTTDTRKLHLYVPHCAHN